MPVAQAGPAGVRPFRGVDRRHWLDGQRASVDVGSGGWFTLLVFASRAIGFAVRVDVAELVDVLVVRVVVRRRIARRVTERGRLQRRLVGQRGVAR